MLRVAWPEYVTAWNRSGIRWRDMSAVELLWLAHVNQFEYLAENRRSGVRRYLLDSGDLVRLRQWDAGAFSNNEITEGMG